ncbi:alpha-amylase family glycosyl hydrolase [Horticoccus luteus]|uniref:alpha-amylase family glycosyl hydrolase n=1 Tax=Horticoccus luteus TaxID=2862869 RepID=UPI0021022013|nr:alpha-amylase family glycosyl hydrolase [Horticoccus luteus]
MEFTRDWSGDAAPVLALQGFENTRPHVTFAAAPREAAATRYGYYVDDGGRVNFVLPRAPGRSERIYVAGDFNGWQQAVGQDNWLLEAGELLGEPVWRRAVEGAGLLTEPWRRFKFVTAEHQWVGVPDNAPNRVTDDAGHANRGLDPARTGAQLHAFTTAAALDLAETWTVLAIGADGVEAVAVEPGDFFFALKTELPLGALVRRGATTFRLFAPRARRVQVRAAAMVAEVARATAFDLVRRADEPAVWEVTVNQNLHGWFYSYAIEGPRDGRGVSERHEGVLDPYAFAAVGRKGPGMVLDQAWIGRGDRRATPRWQDLVIVEGHVRDLAANAPIKLSPAERMGFTGLRKWVESPEFYVHALGANCLELQPVQEFDSQTPAEYHWGYMTVNWFAPASAYALNAERASGVRELQALVAACHRRGIAVLLDVVFNHVGVPPHLMAIDRRYYFEQDEAGRLTNWSGCGNDLRASAAMAQRLIIDSCRHLIEAYGVDGFRFDLAELLGVEVLRAIETALKETKPDVVLIAEPWSFRGHIAGALRDTGWSSWNDGFRDFVRSYVRGGGSAERCAYFLKGSPWYWSKWPAQTVNYTESHDDRTWIDVITENGDFDGSRPTDADRVRTHLMAACLLAAVGIPMLAAGQDFLRSKHGVNNTYQRGDLNALDYKRAEAFAATHAYFANWIQFRAGRLGRLLRLYSPPTETYFRVFAPGDSTACALLYNADESQGRERLLFAINPNTHAARLVFNDESVLNRDWRLVADQAAFRSPDEASERLPHELALPALSCRLWVDE